MPNVPPQTGIIDFLRRLDDPNDRTFLDKFNDNPEALMTLCGLTPPQKEAILSGDDALITAEIGREFFFPPIYHFVRFAHARSAKWHLDYEFPDPPPPHAEFTPQDLVARLQKDVGRLNEVIAQLALSLQ